MSYTMEDFNRDYARKQFEKLTPEERKHLFRSLPLAEKRKLFLSLPLEERLAGASEEQILQYLDALKAGNPAKPRKPRRRRSSRSVACSPKLLTTRHPSATEWVFTL